MNQENHTHKKRKGLSFLTLSLIIAAITVFVFYIYLGDSEKNDPTLIINDKIVPTPEVIYEYINYVDHTDRKKTELHEYISQGIQLLTASLTELVNLNQMQDIEITNKRKELWEIANYIKLNPQSEYLSDSIKVALLTSSEIIISVQEKNFTDLSPLALNLLEIAETINPNEPLNAQRNTIHLFFTESADILKTMVMVRTSK
ncbi:MAG: hypothetical protein H0V01_13560 [Bacteroidetes bacterium]|nr:hypothetical protein [Bacteroidota bacterium]HET6245453.1 hypothetical protein [Bacteroidia bacterium]